MPDYDEVFDSPFSAFAHLIDYIDGFYERPLHGDQNQHAVYDGWVKEHTRDRLTYVMQRVDDDVWTATITQQSVTG